MDRLWRYAGEATFSWEGQDGAVQTPPSPGSESGDDPALDSDSQGEGSSDRSDSGDSDGEAQGQVLIIIIGNRNNNRNNNNNR